MSYQFKMFLFSALIPCAMLWTIHLSPRGVPYIPLKCYVPVLKYKYV